MQVLGLQRCRQQPANHVEDLRRQDDPDEAHQRVHLGGLGEPRRHHGRQRPREHHEQRDADASREQEEIRNGTEGLPAAIAVAASEVFQEHRNEHDRQRSCRQEVVQEVRQREAREIEVRLAARAERPADDLLPHQAHDAAQEDRDAPDRRGDADGARAARLPKRFAGGGFHGGARDVVMSANGRNRRRHWNAGPSTRGSSDEPRSACGVSPASRCRPRCPTGSHCRRTAKSLGCSAFRCRWRRRYVAGFRCIRRPGASRTGQRTARAQGAVGFQGGKIIGEFGESRIRHSPRRREVEARSAAKGDRSCLR